MDFEWDDAKNRANKVKHDLTFEEAKLIFDGPVLSRPDGRRDYGEMRTLSIGMIYAVVAVLVVHTDRSGRTRIISARLANRFERRDYYDHFGATPPPSDEQDG